MHLPRFNTIHTDRKTIINLIIVLLLLLAAFVAYTLGSMFRPARVYENTYIQIPEGYSISQAATLLEEQGIIRSAAAYKLMNKVNPLTVKSGIYEFIEGSHQLQEVRVRLHRADYGDVYTTITIPEGSTRKEIAEILERSPLDIDGNEFLAMTEGKEGYLFPDTYFLLPNTTVEEVIEQLTDTFEAKTENLNSSNRSFNDIIIMASIVEKESSSDPVEMATVAGILWKRIEKGMPLQVDAPFLYALGKTSAQLSTADLRTNSAYNTYTNRGLPPTAIGNPGLQAIKATINPIDSVYFFYLHDTNGGIHYGVTHDDHVKNKNTYLR